MGQRIESLGPALPAGRFIKLDLESDLARWVVKSRKTWLVKGLNLACLR